MATENNASNPIYKRFYDDMPIALDTSPEVMEALKDARRQKKQLPVYKVSNKILIYNESEIIQYIIDCVGGDTKAIYWTDEKRNPIEITYHTYFDEETKRWIYIQYNIQDGKITGHREIQEELAVEIRESYMKPEFIQKIALSKFTNSNSLNIQCSLDDIAIRKIDDSRYVVAEADYNYDDNAVFGVIRY